MNPFLHRIMLKQRLMFLAFALTLVSSMATGQVTELADSTSTAEELKKSPQKLTVFGYYRLFVYGRTLTEPYPNLSPYERAYGVGDGYREPMLSLNVLARPSGRTSLGTELYFFTPYLGNIGVDNDFSLNLGLNFYGNFRTDHGKFGIRAGGIHWYNLSPFTVGVYQILDRFSIFDRTPWEGVNNMDKYSSYYRTGSPNPGDLRWNNQAFQGLIIDGAQLPGNMGFDLFWGKMQPNGGLPGAITMPMNTIQNQGTAGNYPSYAGFGGMREVEPSYMAGGRLQKKLRGDQHVSYNGIYSQTALDSLGRQNWNYQVHTMNMLLQFDDLYVEGEFGAGSFQSPITERQWGEALMLRLRIPKRMTWIPLDVQLYQISPNFFNLNGEIITNGNPAIQENFPVSIFPGQGSVGGLITQVNQLAHNRRGINLNTQLQFGDLKVNLGWGLAAELEALSSELSYVHRINGLALSRIYAPFPADATQATVFGPYNRQVSFFRGVFERVQTTDVDGATAAALTKKYFNAVDIQAKYKLHLANRPLYLFYLGTYGSASSEALLMPALRENSYLFVQYHEFDLYYELVPKFILTGYFGIERARGGRFTEWGENQQPRNQTGVGIGGGFDWTLHKSTGLYVRYRHMQFADQSFELDRYRGYEVTVELKTFF
jgi:hypothetical protein